MVLEPNIHVCGYDVNYLPIDEIHCKVSFTSDQPLALGTKLDAFGSEYFKIVFLDVVVSAVRYSDNGYIYYTGYGTYVTWKSFLLL